MSGASSAAVAERFPPSLTGLLACSIQTDNANGTLVPITQDDIAVLIPVPQPIVVSNIWVSISSAGIGLTANQNLLGLCDAAGNLLSLSGDQSATWLGQGTFSTPLLSGPVRLAAGYCWGRVLAGGTTTPTFRCGGSSIGVNVGPGLQPGNVLRAQRVALGAINIASFNPAISNTPRNLIEVGLS